MSIFSLLCLTAFKTVRELMVCLGLCSMVSGMAIYCSTARISLGGKRLTLRMALSACLLVVMLL